MTIRSARWTSAIAAGLLCIAGAAGAMRLPEDAATTQEAIDRASTLIRTQAGARRLMLLGELHGTREVPQLVASLAARDAAEGPVVVAVEIDHAEQAAIDDYLRSDGSAAARDRLRSRPYWLRSDTRHDGRRNEDLIDLFEQVRTLRRAGRDIAVLAFDVPAARDHHARDHAMATVLRAAYRALPRGRMIVVTGNVHAMLERPRDAPALMQVPAGAYLRDLDPASFRITARRGAFQACRDVCGPMAVDGGGERSRATRGPYHHVIVLPEHRIARLIGPGGAR